MDIRCMFGHDWFVFGSRPDWSTVEPVYFIQVDDEVRLSGWTVEWGCSRCQAERIRRFTPVGDQYPNEVKSVVKGDSRWK